MGSYDPSTRVISICEPAVTEIAEKLKVETNHRYLTKDEVYSLLRELVRLHEHAHAFTHTSTLDAFIKNIFEAANIEFEECSNRDKWYRRLGSDIHEPLAEFISYILLTRTGEGESLPTRVFHDTERNFPLPPHYLKWKDLWTEIKCKWNISGESSRSAMLCIIPLVLCSVRTRKWGSWKEFFDKFAELMENNELRASYEAAVLAHVFGRPE